MLKRTPKWPETSPEAWSCAEEERRREDVMDRAGGGVQGGYILFTNAAGFWGGFNHSATVPSCVGMFFVCFTWIVCRIVFKC